jgi:hypothetical protein
MNGELYWNWSAQEIRMLRAKAQAERDMTKQMLYEYQGKRWEARIPTKDPPNLETKWLKMAEETLSMPKPYKSQLRTCRIGLRPFSRKGGRARAMMGRLNDALGNTDSDKD